MSGFVVGFGNPTVSELKPMFELIEHRGPFSSGIYENKQVIMAQNYLRADGPAALGTHEIPFASSRDDNLRVCYDGQFGTCNPQPGPSGTPDEQLLLDLYQESGPEVCGQLDDAIFSFVCSNGEQLFAARDPLGIKTLFYGRKEDTLYLASELKSITEITNEAFEFPPGHYMTEEGELVQYAALPERPQSLCKKSIDHIAGDIRSIIEKSFSHRVDFAIPTGCLLSGGIDSSVICSIANKIFRERFGPEARIKTYSLGVGESGDIHNARTVAEFLDTDHEELIVSIDDLLAVLPEVIYYLESFDPSLVRSSVSNYLICRFAKEHGIEILLSGEGGDEVFCGYSHLKSLPPEDLFGAQIKCLDYLHSNASLRLDRMNQCNSVKVVTPLISGELLQYALTVPPEYKMREQNGNKVEKWIFRKAFEGKLPDQIIWRRKLEFSQGSGSASQLPQHFEQVVSDAEFQEARLRYPFLRSKEEFYYFRIFTNHFGSGQAVETVGQWISL